MVLGCGAKVTRSCWRGGWGRGAKETTELFQLRWSKTKLHASLSSSKELQLVLAVLQTIVSFSASLFLHLPRFIYQPVLTLATPPRACVPEDTTQRATGASEALDRTRATAASSASGGDDRSVSSNC
jgi:hypothetical protein